MATYAGHTYTNGSVPAAILAPLDGENAGPAELRRDAAASWNRARAEVQAATGIVLTVRGWNRTLAEQERFFFERYRAGATSPWGDYRWYEGVRYGRVTGAPAAIPGTSNHGWGLAVDVVDFGDYGTAGNARRAASIAILKRHGWTDHEGQSIAEPWHLVYDPARDTHPPTQEDDMTPQESAKLDRALALLEKIDEHGMTETWLHKRIGGTNRRRDDGTRIDPTISEDLSVIRQRLTALAAANKALAESMGADPAAIEAAVERAVRDALADGVTLTSKEN